MEPILEAKKLNLWYGPNHALHDVSIAIPEHEITAFIGPSGCGGQVDVMLDDQHAAENLPFCGR